MLSAPVSPEATGQEPGGWVPSTEKVLGVCSPEFRSTWQQGPLGEDRSPAASVTDPWPVAPRPALWDNVFMTTKLP